MQPKNPDPKFDFMLKNQQQAKRTLGLPRMSKPVKIGLAAAAVIIVLILGNSILSGRGGGATTEIVGALARGQETIRVTEAAQHLNLSDPSTQALASTVDSALTSDQSQLEGYLTNNHHKVGAADLAADTDKSMDAQLQSASQNNSLDQLYVTYLKTALAKYQSDLQKAYTGAGPNGQAIIKNSLDGLKTLLATPPLKR